MTTHKTDYWHNGDMKELSEIRRDNFLRLLEEFKNTHNQGREFGVIAAFARYYNMSQTHVSQIKNGTSKIGEPLARQIEEKTGKPALWMDDEHHLIDMSDPGQVDYVDVAMTLYRASPDNAKDALLKALREIVEKQNKPKH